MKVLLIRARLVDYVNSQGGDCFDSSIGLVPPLGIAYIASFLNKHGHDVSILDCEAENSCAADIKREIEKEDPDIVGVSAITTNIHGALESCRIAKECGKTVVIGGSHMVIFPTETMTYSYIDYGVCGEGEQPMLELLKAIENKGDISRIAGLAYRRNGKVVINGIARNDNLDSLPWPAYHLLPLERYEMVNTGKIVCMFTTRGCPYKCTFCFRNPILDKVRKRDPVKVVDEIEHVNKEYGIKYFNFVDETITLYKEHIGEICEDIVRRKLKISYQSPTRVNHVDEELLRKMKRSGCETLRFGVESGDEDILRIIDKRIRLEDSRKAFRLCRKIGIKTVGYFMIGYIGETEETIKKTIQFAKELNPDYPTFFPATPMPNTRLFDMAVDRGLVDKNYWSDFVLGKRKDPLPFIFPDAGDYAVKAYKEFYFRPSYIMKTLLRKETYHNLSKFSKAAFNLFKMRYKR